MPLDILCLDPEFNKVPKAKLSRFKLSDSEWVLVKQLAALLKVGKPSTKVYSNFDTVAVQLFYQASTGISKSKASLIYQVIPTMDVILDQLNMIIVNVNNVWLPFIRAAASRSLSVILKYYNKTDDNRMIRIGISSCHYAYCLLDTDCSFSYDASIQNLILRATAVGAGMDCNCT